MNKTYFSYKYPKIMMQLWHLVTNQLQFVRLSLHTSYFVTYIHKTKTNQDYTNKVVNELDEWTNTNT